MYRPLVEAGPVTLETVTVFLEQANSLEATARGGNSLEATARALFVHPNPVRYRLRRFAELTGAVPGTARGASPCGSPSPWAGSSPAAPIPHVDACRGKRRLQLRCRSGAGRTG